ncbi:hypothetical protein [Nocardioides convexus]|uniref:hypothetical protein n=1 Tax=Nocardioides convexus TaxID=2712224 RepID=UPI00241860E2|nr:hypothetical protein [Nocardioides convexus]
MRVATPEDPASSRLGESLYRFWPRTVWGSLKRLLGGRGEALPPQGHAPLPRRQRRAQRLGHVRRAVGRGHRAQRLGGRGLHPDHRRVRLLAPGGRQLPRALRPQAPAGR